jgi:hypothetical protein
MSPNKGLLKFAIALCLIFALTRLGEFIFAHIPPHKAGECFEISTIVGLTAMVVENHIIEGYSDITLDYSFQGFHLKDPTKAFFTEQRQDFGEKTTCP